MGKEQNVWDLDDHRYINFLNGFTSGVYGHSHPKIIEALQQAMAGGLNLSSLTQEEAKLATAI